MGKTLDVVRAMEKGLAANEADMGKYFHEDFVWDGNRGCGTKEGLLAFRANWQLPLRTVLTDRTYETDHWMEDGDWAACYGKIIGTHSGPFMGIAPTGKRVTLPYIDFWQIRDGRIAYNKVSVDFAQMLYEMGHDVFDGQGWEAFDEGRLTPAWPDGQTP